jgi:hypothetical protein
MGGTMTITRVNCEFRTPIYQTVQIVQCDATMQHTIILYQHYRQHLYDGRYAVSYMRVPVNNVLLRVSVLVPVEYRGTSYITLVGRSKYEIFNTYSLEIRTHEDQRSLTAVVAKIHSSTEIAREK